MKKRILISVLSSLAAIALVSCATSKIKVARSSNDNIITDVTNNGSTPSNHSSNAVTKVNVEVYMNGGKYNGAEYCTFSVRPGTLWRSAKNNVDLSKITYDQYHTFKMFSFKQYEDDEIPDSYVVPYTESEEPLRFYVRYNVDIPPELQCKVRWLNDNDQPLTGDEIYGKGEIAVYKGPEPEHSYKPGHEYYFTGWDPDPIYPLQGDVTFKAQYFDVTPEHTVTFDLQYDDIKNYVTVKHGDKVDPITPTRTGWSFGGWYETSSCEGNPFDFSTPINADLTLYAKWTQNECTVNFHHQDKVEGETITTVTVKYGEKVTPFVPTLEHFDFVAWVDSQGVNFNFDTPIIDTTDLYATWDRAYYTVNFDLKGAPGHCDPITAQYLDQVDLPSPSWEGHSFKGWKLNGSEVDDPYTILDNVTLDASWSQDTCTVTFDWEDGVISTETTKTVKYGERVIPETPTYEGHTFKYWSGRWLVDPEPFNFNTPITEDIELYAMWDDVYSKVTFFCNGGHFPDSSATSTTRSVIYGGTIDNEPLTGDAPEDPVREDGYSFDGWYDANGNKFQFSTLGVGGTQVYSDIELHAAWDRYDASTVTFYANDEVWSTKTVPYGEVVAAPDNPTKPGCVFTGWYDELGRKFDFDTKIYASFNLYAHFSEPQQCTVTFVANGGTPEPDPITVGYGGVISPPTEPVKDGFTFGGWYDNSACTGDPYTFGTEVKSSFVLYAKWDPVAKLVVRFMDDQTELSRSEVVYGDKVTRPNDPTKEGHTFLGWLKDGQPFNFDTPITQSIDLYASWSGIEQCTVTFITNGGPDVSSQTVSYGSTINDPGIQEWPGHDFGGWYLDKGFTTPYVFTTLVKSSFNLYEKWTSVSDLTVKFMDGQEQIGEDVPVAYGDKVTRPENPTKEGYSFVGWYSDATFEAVFDFDTRIIQDTLIYAKFEESPTPVDQVTVSFDTQGGTYVPPQTFDKGGTATEPACTREGFTLDGWYYTPAGGSETKFVFGDQGTQVNEDMVLTAKWTQNECTVKFMDGDQQIGNDVTVAYGDKVTRPENPTKEGYSFVGWYSDATFEAVFDFDTRITNNTTIYAKFEAVTPPAVEHSVNFHFNNDTGSGEQIETIQVVEGGTFEKPIWVPTYEGHTFNGWFDAQTGGTEYTFPGTMSTNDIDIYAQWTETPTPPTGEVMVTFDPDGGSYVAPQFIESGATISQAPECSREGYVLDGWYYTPTGGSETKFEFGTTTLTENTTLKAKWIALARGVMVDISGTDVKINIGETYLPEDEYDCGEFFYFDDTVRAFNIHTSGGGSPQFSCVANVIINGTTYDIYNESTPGDDYVAYSDGVMYLPNNVTGVTSILIVMEM